MSSGQDDVRIGQTQPIYRQPERETGPAERITIQLPPGIVSKLRAQAKAQTRSVSRVAARYIRAGLASEE